MINLIITLLIVGFALWLVQIAPFIDGTIKRVIQGIVVLVVLIWLLRHLPALGL